jgi:hypothetical protein
VHGNADGEAGLSDATEVLLFTAVFGCLGALLSIGHNLKRIADRLDKSAGEPLENMPRSTKLVMVAAAIVLTALAYWNIVGASGQ